MRHQDTVYSAQFSPDNRRIVTASADQTVQVWDLATGQKVGTPLWHPLKVDHSKYSLNGRRIVTTSGGIELTWEWGVDRYCDTQLMCTLAHFLGGAILRSELGTLKVLSWSERKEIWNELRPALEKYPEWLFLARTAFSRSPDTPVSPRSNSTIRDSVLRLIQTQAVGHLKEAYYADPSHPLIHMSVA